MNNPFDDTDGSFRVVVNDEEQYSLWPAFAAVPDGWSIALDQTSRDECMQFIKLTWKDLRPKSLRDSMELDTPSLNN
jgi:MbtH protein